MSSPRSLPHQGLVLVVLLAAAGLRLVGLVGMSPPGLSHDEVANWLIDRSILAGNHAVYFVEAYGHEAGFHYIQSGFVALLGDNGLALRLPAAFLGLLVVAVTYALNRRLFGRRVALLCMAVVAVALWPVFFSRQGLRAMMLPFTAGLSLYFFWTWLKSKPLSQPSSVYSLLITQHSFYLAVLFAALSTYTYMASRALPFLYGGFFLYLALFHRPVFRQRWPQLILFALLYAALSWPLVAYIRAEPAAEVRIAEVDAPLRALQAGDWGPVLANSWAVFKMFGLEGDPLWRQNVAGRPVFGPPLALLFYAGLLLALWRWRQPRWALPLLALAAAALPSIATVDPPSSIRMILFLPFLGTFPAVVIHRLSRLSTVIPQLSTVFRGNLGITVLTTMVLLFSGWATGRAIFQVWPANEEVAFVWQAALTDIAADLDGRQALDQVVVAGWTPGTMDPPTMALALKREDVALRHAGTVGEIRTVLLPAGDPDAAALYRPADLPFAPLLAERLTDLGITGEDGGTFVRYRWPAPLTAAPDTAAAADFGGELRLLGYDEVGGCEHGGIEPCQIVTYWRVERVPAGERRFFLHQVDGQGEILAQEDGLDAPARFWRPGDLLLHVHTLPPGSGELRLGVYDPTPPFPRLSLPNGRDYITLK